MRMPMAVIVVMMMLVVVMTSPGRDRRAFGIGAAFGIEWRHDRLAMATQALDHVGDHMIVADAQARRIHRSQQLGRQVAIAQMPRDPDERAQRIGADLDKRSEAHTSELQSLMRISYAVFCLKKKKKHSCKN